MSQLALCKDNLQEEEMPNRATKNIVALNEFGHIIQQRKQLSAIRKFMQANFGVKPFVGSLDEVSVWARALSATEVANLTK